VNEQEIANKICTILTENGIRSHWEMVDIDEDTKSGKIEIIFDAPSVLSI
jgi:hypothetical protein